MKNILIFGGSGFLGSYLSRELLKRQYNVTVADIKPSIVVENTQICDITSEDQIKAIFSTNSFDTVFNLSGFANLDQANLDPLMSMELNIMGNIRILEQCVKHKIKRIVYASSVYAMSEVGSFYGISKSASEKIVKEYLKVKQLPYTIIRYGSVYSEQYFDNNYIYSLVSSAIENKKIIHHGDGEEYREYIHASDAASLSVDLIENDNYLNETVTLTGSFGIKRKELFNMINEILGGEINIEFQPKENKNHYQFTPYSFTESKHSKKLTPNPQIDFGEGLYQCIRNAYERRDNKV